MKRKFLLLGLIAIFIVALPTVFAALTYQLEMPTTGSVVPGNFSPTATPTSTPSSTPAPVIEIQMCTEDGTPINQIDWGTITAHIDQFGASTTVMIKNTGTVPVTLNMTVTPGPPVEHSIGIIPVMHANNYTQETGIGSGSHGYAYIIWDSENTRLNPGENTMSTIHWGEKLGSTAWVLNAPLAVNFNVVVTATEA